ncbi:dephospho-CoA kinase [Kocuria sp. HSID17590]|uniref:dephospho-CoA kinase n=2 Tax=unclassified Kocuria TaxID=2649579 RepID=UPI000F88C9F7|nr:dephospho-CoA kinase [Kocuria sp. HSID17590]RUP84901.1 dephospho-CoA kinase [Kocuria sp. HSID17590]
MLHRLHDRLGLRTTPSIFFVSAALIVVFTAAMSLFPGPVQGFFGGIAHVLRYRTGWFYTFSVTALVIFAVGLALSRYGRVKIGDDDSQPAYSGLTWFGMLFAAGVGAVLMFWGVAEPINHYANPPMYGTDPESDRAAVEALNIANFHFGVHMWAILAVPGLAFGYFTYKRKLPPRVSSAFHPLLGDGIHGPWGKAIDVLSIVATVFGLGVSVGLGALQINSGLTYVYGIPMAGWIQAAIIAVITAVGLASVLAGMEKGVKRLSYANIVLAVALLLFVLMAGASMDTMRAIVESVGGYAQQLPTLAFFNDTYGGGTWSGDWTVFYWAWTVTWAPFVGMFVAKISRGRTIREFVVGVLGVPSAFVVVWMAIYGYNAIRIDRAPGTRGTLTETIVTQGNPEAALFQFLQTMPWFAVTAFVALIVITVFFITSIDSGALVMDAMANGHEDEGPRRQRIFWTLAVGAVCTAIIATSGENGLNALQEVIIVIGAPVMLLEVLQAVMLLQALRQDAGTARPMRTRQWKRVLPAEEYHRRAQEDGAAVSEYVIRPEYEVGTEPENDTHQPRTWHWQREQEGRPVYQLALTGGASSGKRTAARAFEELGAAVLDSAQMWQQLLEPGTPTRAEVERIFGEQLPTAADAPAEDVAAALDELMARNETARARAHELLMPEMRESARRRAREAGTDRVMVQVVRDPLEAEQRDRFDLVVAVEAPAEERVQRLRRTEGVAADVAWDLVDQAPSDGETRDVADRVIVNDGDVEHVRDQVREIWQDQILPVLDHESTEEGHDHEGTVHETGSH